MAISVFQRSLFAVIINVVSRVLLTDSTGFVISPFDVTVTTNSTADFQCQVNLPSSQYTWIVDGNPLNSLSPPDGISLSISNEVQIMSIFSEESRNMTTVVCRVTLANDTVIRSEEATLFIQDRLDKVMNLLIHPISVAIISWVPPFSLDITGVDPDFTHTVEVYNITSGERSLVDTFQNITDSTFTFSLVNSDPSDLFEFVVFAVNDVGEGEPSQPVRWRFGDEEPVTENNACTQETEDFDTTSYSVDNGHTTVFISESKSGSTTIIASTIAAFFVGVLLGSGISLIMVMIISCLRKHAQQSTALEAESGEIEMKSCDAYNVVAKKQKPVNNQPPAVYEEIDL